MTREQVRQVLVESGLGQIGITNVWAERETMAIMVELRDDELDLVINDEKTMCRTNYHFGEITDFSIKRIVFKYSESDNEEVTEITLNTINGNKNKFFIEC